MHCSMKRASSSGLSVRRRAACSGPRGRFIIEEVTEEEEEWERTSEEALPEEREGEARVRDPRRDAGGRGGARPPHLSPAAVASGWERWAAEGNSALVAEGEDSLLGTLTLHRMVVLHRPRPVGRITSLVVDPGARGRGLGRALVLAAEEASLREGCGLLEVTSHRRFSEAHDFYRHLAFEQTSLRFAKVFDPR